VTANIKPFTNTILKTLFHAVLDEKNSSVKRAFTSSCAIILKRASQAQAQKLIEDTTALHLGEKNAQVSGAVLLRAYLNNAVEVLNGYSAVVIHVTFVSRYVQGLVYNIFIHVALSCLFFIKTLSLSMCVLLVCNILEIKEKNASKISKV
jgi:hypothetical protein